MPLMHSLGTVDEQGAVLLVLCTNSVEMTGNAAASRYVMQ